MSRGAWLWLGVGALAAWVLWEREATRGGNTHTLGGPLEGTRIPTVTPHGYFGAPRNGPPRHLHQGIDLAASVGTRVLAVGDGVIVPTRPGLGRVVRKLKLSTPSAWTATGRLVGAIVYADLGLTLVQVGERVTKGQPIALVWPQGFVHFAVKEIRSDGAEAFFDPALAGFDYRAGSTSRIA